MKYLFPLIMLCVSGCIKLLPDPLPPAQKIWLASSKPVVQNSDLNKHANIQLIIEQPQLSALLDSVKIQVINQQNNIPTATYLSGYELPDRLGNIIQQNLLQHFSASHHLFSVLPAEGNNNGSLKLKINLSMFTLNLMNQPTIIVEGQLTCIDVKANSIKDQQHLHFQVPNISLNIVDITRGYSEALGILNQHCYNFMANYFN